MSANKTNQNPWAFDVRVRERNLKSGLLNEKDLEKHLAGLPDLEATTEAFGTHQPALEAPEDLDDEDDLDDEEDEDEQEEEEAPAPAPADAVADPEPAPEEPGS